MTARWTDIELLAPENLPVTEQEDEAFRALPWLMAAAEEAAEGVQRECDPSGKGLHEPGAKADAGKPLAGVLLDFAHALSAVVDVGTMGANKYSRGGWMSVENAQTRYLDAAMRHLLKHGQGEASDPESGLSHLSHCAWNVLALIELQARGAR